jgi:hypothetical protein
VPRIAGRESDIARARRHFVPSCVLSHGCQWFVNLRRSLADASGYLFVATQRVQCRRERLRGVRINARRGLESAGLCGCSFLHFLTPFLAWRFLTMNVSLIRCASLAALLMFCVAATAQDAKTQNVPPEGFTALFNGKDLTNWQGLVKNIKERKKMTTEEIAKAQVEADKIAHAHWSVKEGVLEFDGKGQSLCTVKDYGDFELYCDWKIKPKGDSGLYLRGTPQVQIWDPSDEGQLKNGADKGSGSLWNNQKHDRFPKVKADKPIGEWNTFHIKMVGDKVTIHLNGQLVTDTVLENYWDRSIPCYEKGPIELQNHGNTLYFRNIFIKEL